MKDFSKLFETVMNFKGLSFLVTEQSMIKKWRSVCFFAMVTHNFSLNVFLNNTSQNCHSYMISMIKLKSFKLSLKWRQERIFNSMRLVSMLRQSKNMKIL